MYQRFCPGGKMPHSLASKYAHHHYNRLDMGVETHLNRQIFSDDKCQNNNLCPYKCNNCGVTPKGSAQFQEAKRQGMDLPY